MRLLFIGFGTVGQGLAELLIEKQNMLRKQYGLTCSVVGISDLMKGSVYHADGIDLAAALTKVKAGENLSELDHSFAGDALDMIGQSNADMMVEMTYTDLKTGEPATSHVKAALRKRMHVTTTNKGPVALFSHELKALAQENKVEFFYEGTVLSGTPMLNLIRESLAATRISEIKGILNGTTNYILTQMEAGMDYDSALKEAQELGYAEAVPDADVLGWDALAKVTILANTVLGAHVKPDEFPCEGITGITADDIAKARTDGKKYKLIGKVWREGDVVKGKVAPEQVPMTHPLAGVMGATNAVTITTDALGDVTIVGPGAGRTETGYSTLVDIIAAGGAQ
jgi:homoserine dehydrogenase